MKKLIITVGRILMLNVFAFAGANAWANPIILNATESANPGDVVYLQGDNFTTSAQVWFHNVLPSDTTLVPDVQLTPLLSNTNQAITVRLPKNIPPGLYAVWVFDGSNYSAPMLINGARATSFEFPEVSAGYTFRIFGRNLSLPGSTPLVTLVNGANSYPATVVTSYPNDGNVLQVTAPGNLPTSGTFTVNVSNGYGHNGSLSAPFDVSPSEQTIQARAGGDDPFSLGVPWGADFVNIAANVINAVTSTNPHTGRPYGADPTGGSNSVSAIQQALTDAGTSSLYPNGATVYLPAGTYLIDKGTANAALTIPTKVVLKGAGIDQTIFNDVSQALSSSSYFIAISSTTGQSSGSYSGVTGFTYNQNMTVSATTYPPSIRNFGYNSTKIFFDHIKANFAHGVFLTTNGGTTTQNVICGQFVPQWTNENDILVQNCTMSYFHFGNNNYYSYNYTYGSNYIFRNNAFSSYFNRLSFLYMGNVLIENNHFTRDGQFPPPAAKGVIVPTTSGGIDSTGPDKTILNNVLDGTNLPLAYVGDGESILCESGLIYTGYGLTTYLGMPSAVGTNTLTDSTQNWGTNSLISQNVKITKGTGAGQSAIITGNTLTTLTINQNWNPEPAAIGQTNPSQYEITPVQNFSGTATEIGTKTLTDTLQNWVPNSLNNTKIVSITGGQGSGQWAVVASNTANLLTLDRNWNSSNPPVAGSTYAVQLANSYVLSTVSSATSTTLTDTTQSWPGGLSGTDGFHVGDTVAIVSGIGAGQVRTVTSNTSNTLTVGAPWTETPGAGSQYSINGALTMGAQRWLIKGNTFHDVVRGVVLYLGGYDCVVVNNHLVSGGGIFIAGQQRDYLDSNGIIPNQRMDIAANNLIADNVVTDPDYQDGANYNRAPFYAIHANLSYSSPPFGSIVWGTEARRNILQDQNPNTTSDTAFACDPCYASIARQSTSGNLSNGVAALLDSVFTDNISLQTIHSHELTTGDSQAAFWDSIDQFTGTELLDSILTGDSVASVLTTSGGTPSYFDANFSGSGNGTGGNNVNLIDAGGSATLVAGSGGSTTSVLSSTPLDAGGGSYLECAMSASGGNTGVQVTPTLSRSSWARIFDQRAIVYNPVNGQYLAGNWLVNGAFDFFMRPAQDLSVGNQMRPIDMGNGIPNGIRLVFAYYGSNQVMLQVITPTGGGGNSLILGTYTPGFQAGNTYHFGVTFSTDPTNSYITTAKIFVSTGTGSIDTTSSSNLVGSGTFQLVPSVVNDANSTDWFNGGTWSFGDQQHGQGVFTNDYDGLHLYNVSALTFPALDAVH